MTKPRACIMGHPVAHSRSPRLHRHWLDRYGIAGHYVPLAIRPEDPAEVLRALASGVTSGPMVPVPR